MTRPKPAAPDDPRVELVMRTFSRGSRDDFGWLADATHPDGLADWSRSRGPYRGIYRGRDEVLGFFRGTREAWEDVEYFHDEMLDAGQDRIIRVGGMRARGKGSGVAVEAAGAQLFEFKDGLIWRVTLYQSKEEAVAAVEPDSPT
jgi:ketosteroid isomerase-like protein